MCRLDQLQVVVIGKRVGVDGKLVSGAGQRLEGCAFQQGYFPNDKIFFRPAVAGVVGKPRKLSDEKLLRQHDRHQSDDALLTKRTFHQIVGEMCIFSNEGKKLAAGLFFGREYARREHEDLVVELHKARTEVAWGNIKVSPRKIGQSFVFLIEFDGIILGELRGRRTIDMPF